MTRLAGTTAIVTGGAGGIGAAIGQALLARGVRVCLADVDRERVHAQASSLGSASDVMAVEIDVTNPQSWARTATDVVDRWGGINLLFNNAGVGGDFAGLLDYDAALWQWILDVNVSGAFHGVRAVLPHIRAAGRRGHIVNTASIAGLLPATRNAGYLASKYAMVGLTEALRLELRGEDVGVSMLCPGIVATGLLANTKALGQAVSDISRDGIIPDMLASGMDPRNVAVATLDSIEQDLFFIFPSGAWREPLNAYHNIILASLERSCDANFEEDLLPVSALLPLAP